MRSWPTSDLPTLPVRGPAVALHDTSTGGLVTPRPDGPARMYVCGITPYDATHIGHAATYVGFDLLHRAWRNAGLEVLYVQNVTDVDDPLLERATKVGADWVELAERETELFRQDMTALRVLPPTHYVGAVESIPLVIELIQRLQAAGARLRASRTTSTSPSPPTRPSARSPAVPRGDAPDLPRARRRSRPRGQEGPARLRRLARRAAGRAGLGQPVRARPTRLARRVHGDRPRPARRRRSTSRAAGPTWCSRTTRCAPTRPRSPPAAVRAGVRARRDGRLRRREDVEVPRQPGVRLAAAVLGRRPDGDPPEPAASPLPQRLGVGGRRALGLRRHPGPVAARLRAAAGAPAAPVVDEVLAALADDLDAPRACAAIDAWVHATLGTDGLADVATRCGDPAAGDATLGRRRCARRGASGAAPLTSPSGTPGGVCSSPRRFR